MSNYEQFRTIMKDAGFALSNKPVSKKILENAISFSKCDKKTVLAKQHEIHYLFADSWKAVGNI